MGETITTRIDNQMARDIEFFSKLNKLDKSAIARRLLAKSLEQEKLEYALDKYKKGEITIGRAAEMLGKDIRSMMIIAAQSGIPFQYSLKDLKSDFEAARKSK